jgi:CheY-like chemotaxis protein
VQQAYLDKIGNAGKTLAHLINDLLDLSKIVAGHLEFENTTFSLRQMLGRSDSLMSYKAVEKGLQLIETVDDAVPDMLIGDPLRIEQILLNLISNAIKFTAAGRVEVRIKVVAGEVTSEVTGAAERICLAIEVEDTGVGLQQEQIELLFKPFAQADNSMTRKYGGTGLGLAICKRLSEMMGGGISVSSTLGQGSIFRVTLWLGVGKAEDLPAAGDPGNAGAPACYADARVLVVEDQALNREIVDALLNLVGIAPRMVCNGQEALDLLAEAGPDAFDLVLMDIQMPVMDGLTATRALRAQSGFENLPVIAMTAHTMAHEREVSAAAGITITSANLSITPVSTAALPNGYRRSSTGSRIACCLHHHCPHCWRRSACRRSRASTVRRGFPVWPAVKCATGTGCLTSSKRARSPWRRSGKHWMPVCPSWHGTSPMPPKGASACSA